MAVEFSGDGELVDSILLKGEADMRIRKPGGRLAAVIELHEQQPPPSPFRKRSVIAPCSTRVQFVSPHGWPNSYACWAVVPPGGLEPTHLTVLDFESSASTNSTTGA